MFNIETSRLIKLMALLLGSLSMTTAASLSTEATSLLMPETHLPELKELLKSAELQAPQLIEQSIAEEEAQERLKQAKSAYYPRLDLNSNLGFREISYNTATVEDESSAAITFYASITRPFYHWGAIESLIKQAKLDNNSEALHRELIMRQIKRSIRAEYLSLLINKENLLNLNLQKKIAESDLEQFASRSQLGRVSDIDADLSEVNLSQHIMNIDRALADQIRITNSFKRKTGYTGKLSLKDSIKISDLNQIEGYVALQKNQPSNAWTDQHGEVRRLQNRILREQEEMIRIKSRQRPLINFAAHVSQDQRNVALQNNVDALTYFMGLSVNWNIFDGFSTSASKRESLLRKNRYQVSLNNYKKEITAQAKHILEQIEFQVKLVRIELKRAELHAARYTSKYDESEDGRISSKQLQAHALDKSNADLNLIRAQSSLLLMLNDYLDLVTPIKNNTY